MILYRLQRRLRDESSFENDESAHRAAEWCSDTQEDQNLALIKKGGKSTSPALMHDCTSSLTPPKPEECDTIRELE